MNLVPRGSVSVDPHSPLRGAPLAQSGMAGLIPCIPPSARESAAGDPLGTFISTGQDFDEQELLVLEDNCCPGVSGLFLHGPGQAEPFRGEDTLEQWDVTTRGRMYPTGKARCLAKEWHITKQDLRTALMWDGGPVGIAECFFPHLQGWRLMTIHGPTRSHDGEDDGAAPHGALQDV